MKLQEERKRKENLKSKVRSIHQLFRSPFSLKKSALSICWISVEDVRTPTLSPNPPKNSELSLISSGVWPSSIKSFIDPRNLLRKNEPKKCKATI
jgi:hypothetical protein